MKRSKIWLTGILLGGIVVWNVCENSWAQQWQDPSADYMTAPVDWQERVLKRPQQLQWRPAQTSTVSYEQPVQQDQPAAEYRQSAKPRHPYRTAQRSAQGRNAFDTVSMSQEPTRLATDAEVIPRGEMQYEPIAPDGPFADAGGCANCGGSMGGCDSCDAGCGPAYGDCCDFGWEIFDGRCGRWLRGLSIFAGVDGFKGPLDRGTNGNFGLNEGLNLARPLGDPWGFGYQIGANFVQSDFSGVPTIGASERGRLFPVSYRKQYFVTAALFRRADACGGFQYGIAYDYLYDMYNQNASLQQIRSETGFVIDDVYDIGYYGAYGVGGDRKVDGKLDPTDMFVFYLRRNFENGGDGRIWGGATGNGDGLLGVDLWVPLGKSVALQNRVNYMIPSATTDQNSANYRGAENTRESWGFMIQLIWYPGQNALCQRQNPYRPLFNVADNSLFMVDRLINQTDVH